MTHSVPERRLLLDVACNVDVEQFSLLLNASRKVYACGKEHVVQMSVFDPTTWDAVEEEEEEEENGDVLSRTSSPVVSSCSC